PSPTSLIYTLSLHDALPILSPGSIQGSQCRPKVHCDRRGTHHCGSIHDPVIPRGEFGVSRVFGKKSERRKARRHSCTGCGENSPDRKSTRLNSSHDQISYAV